MFYLPSARPPHDYAEGRRVSGLCVCWHEPPQAEHPPPQPEHPPRQKAPAPRAPRAEETRPRGRRGRPPVDDDPGLLLITRRPPKQKFANFEEYIAAHGGATAPIEGEEPAPAEDGALPPVEP